MRFWLLVITALFLAGCSTHRAPAPNARLSDSITVIAGLNDQLQSWRGTPYRYGGMSRRGVDCSGFVVVTMRDKFDLQLPRDTREQSKIGTRIDKDELLPGDLVFFKTGSGESGLQFRLVQVSHKNVRPARGFFAFVACWKRIAIFIHDFNFYTGGGITIGIHHA